MKYNKEIIWAEWKNRFDFQNNYFYSVSLQFSSILFLLVFLYTLFNHEITSAFYSFNLLLLSPILSILIIILLHDFHLLTFSMDFFFIVFSLTFILYCLDFLSSVVLFLLFFFSQLVLSHFFSSYLVLSYLNMISLVLLIFRFVETWRRY